MGKKLYSPKKVLKKLTDNKIVTFKRRSFTEAVSRGQIPYTIKEGSADRLYDYDEVVKAIQKAGIGRPPEDSQLEDIPEPEEGQSEEDYIKTIEDRLKKKPTLTDANILKTIYDTRAKKFDFDIKQELYILRAEQENTAFIASRVIRDKLLTIPERLSNELASMDAPHTIKELLYKEINILLEGFSKDSFNVK